MSSKRNRNARRNQSRRAPRTRALSGRVSPPRPARSATRNPVVRRGISGQHVGRVRAVPSHGREVPSGRGDAEPASEDVADPAAATPPAPSAWTRARRRLTTSTVALVGIVALEVAALAVLGVHLTSGGDEVAPVAASGFYAAPVQLPAGTAYVRSRVVAPDTLVVTHWIHADRDVDSVRVHVPQVPGPRPVAVSDLVVASDGRSIREATLAPGRVVTSYTVPPGRRIYVSYVLTGAIQPRGSQPGKVLAQVTALDVSAPPVTVTRTAHHVLGARVLGLACSPPLRNAVPRPCGRASGDGWRVDLRGRHSSDRVLARLDLS